MADSFNNYILFTIITTSVLVAHLDIQAIKMAAL